jgi:hypothetical protein
LRSRPVNLLAPFTETLMTDPGNVSMSQSMSQPEGRNQTSPAGARGAPPSGGPSPSGEQAGAGSVVDRGMDAARQAKDQAAEAVESRVTRETGRAAQSLQQFAESIRKASHEAEPNPLAPWVDRVADGLVRVSRSIDGAGPRDLVRAVEGFARREPLLFLGGALAVGVAGARFLKSSGKALQSSTASAAGSMP